MFQRDRLSHWCLSLFVYFLVYHLTVPLVSYGAQAQTVPSKSETQDALEKISEFLQNETGATWLAELAQSQEKAPLTTDELMEAVLGTTKENSTVWRAAATLKSALAAQAQQETIPSTNLTTPSSEPVIDYWSDVITDMEKHDDIICLYRKDTEAKMTKSSDWQKLLKNVSPGYTVHLALDRGSKYVICLKKVNVPTPQTSQTVPPTTIVSTVQDISSTTSMSTQVTEISENDEDLATTINDTTQPVSVTTTINDTTQPVSVTTTINDTTEHVSVTTKINDTSEPVSVTTTTSSTTQAMRSIVQTVTPAAIEENLSSLEDKKDCGKGDANKGDSVKNSKAGISDSSEKIYETGNKLGPENSQSPSPLIVELTTAQNEKICEESDEDVRASSEQDCSEESDAPELIDSPRITLPSHPAPRNSPTSGSRPPVIAQANCLPCCMNPMRRIPYMPRPCLQANIPNPCQFPQNIARNLQAQIPTAGVGAPFFNNLRNIPIWLNPAKPSERGIEPCNGDFEYPSRIPLQPFIPVQKDFQRESWLAKLLSERRDSANRLPLAYLPMMPLYQVTPDCSKVLLPKFGVEEVRKPLISNARVPLQQIHPIIPGYGSFSNAPLNSNPSFLLPQKNHRIPIAVECSGARENPFSLKQTTPFYQTGYFRQSLMGPNSRFPKSLHPRVEPLALPLPRTNEYPAILQPIGKLRFEPCLQNQPIPKCRENFWARNLQKFLPFDKSMIPSAAGLLNIPPNIFPNCNPTAHRNSLPEIPHRNQNYDRLPSLPNHSSPSSGVGPNFAPKLTIEKKWLVQGSRLDPATSGAQFSNPLSPIPLGRDPHVPHNTRFEISSKIPIRNGGYSFGDTDSSMPKMHFPESLNMANKNSIERKMPSIDHSMTPINRGINNSIRKKSGNGVNFSDYIRATVPVLIPKNFFNTWRITGKEKINEAKSNKSHDRSCRNSRRKSIPIEIKIRGSKADSIRINVVPGKGERVKIIDAEKGLFNVQRKEKSRLLDEVFNNRKNFVKKPSNKESVKDDDAENLETRVDETADEFEKHVRRRTLTKDKNFPGTTASSLMSTSTEILKKLASTTEETTKLNNTSQIIDSTRSTGSVNNNLTELHNTSKNLHKSETQ